MSRKELRTPDLGGTSSTEECGQAVADALSSSSVD
jgi:isocitrate/isopropylmalate dehydrogenase